jgi:hypothetical protein
MLTIKQMIRYTPKDIILNSKKVRTKTVKAVADEKKELIWFKFKATTLGKDFYAPEVILKTSSEGKKKALLSLPAWVTCNCPYFTFHCERALVKQKASSVIHTKDYVPKKMTRKPVNPRQIPMVCKHLIASFAKIVDEPSPGTVPLTKETKRALPDIKKYIPK